MLTSYIYIYICIYIYNESITSSNIEYMAKPWPPCGGAICEGQLDVVTRNSKTVHVEVAAQIEAAAFNKLVLRFRLYINTKDNSNTNNNDWLMLLIMIAILATLRQESKRSVRHPAGSAYGQFSRFHVFFCGLDPGNLKFETVRTNQQHICF